MDKADDHGMQCLPFQRRIGLFCRAVHRISQKRMSDTGHVHPDLMGPPGLQTAFDIGVSPKTRQHPLMCHCPLAIVPVDGHFFALGGMTANGRIHRALILRKIADDDSPVPPGDGMLF